ncbi:hypothetical protein GJ496_006932 [Pomphorhynchus laevis]|nr:hypothetical protein GJ496_006932 [Pomphorhynchus laevis]
MSFDWRRVIIRTISIICVALSFGLNIVFLDVQYITNQIRNRRDSNFTGLAESQASNITAKLLNQHLKTSTINNFSIIFFCLLLCFAAALVIFLVIMNIIQFHKLKKQIRLRVSICCVIACLMLIALSILRLYYHFSLENDNDDIIGGKIQASFLHNQELNPARNDTASKLIELNLTIQLQGISLGLVGVSLSIDLVEIAKHAITNMKQHHTITHYPV